MRREACLLATLALMAATVARPEAQAPVECALEGGVARIEGASGQEAQRLCAVMARGLEQLEACGLPMGAPPTLAIVDELAHAGQPCLGAYECGPDRILLTSPEAFEAALSPGTLFRYLPRRAFHDSTLVHELAHAALFRQACAVPPCLAEHEYVAYAMQMQFLAPEHRRILTEAASDTRGLTEMWLNEFVLAASPATFAAWTWVHFSRPENGCGFIARLVSGEAQLGTGQ